MGDCAFGGRERCPLGALLQHPYSKRRDPSFGGRSPGRSPGAMARTATLLFLGFCRITAALVRSREKEQVAKTMIEELRKVIKRLHYPLEVMLLCVRWYAAYPLSFRHLEEMMAERGVVVDHATGSPLVHQDPACPCCGVSAAQAPRRHELEDGRDLHQGGRPMEISVPRGRQ